MGFWIDICTVDVHQVPIRSRIASMKESPLYVGEDNSLELLFFHALRADALLHWVVGMLYMHHFASFIGVLRENLRKGVLWVRV